MPRAALEPDVVLAFRRRVVDAAMHLFAEEGYAAVTMRGLGAALGVSAMTTYRYVAGKDELFAMVRAEAFRRFADQLEAALARGGDAIARLRRLKQAYLAFAIDQPDAYRIMFEVRKPDDPDSAELSTEAKRAFGCLHRTVTVAVAAGQLHGDALTMARVLWASTHGLVSLYLAGRLDKKTLHQLAAIDHELAAFASKRKP